MSGKVWFLAPFRRRKIKGIEMFANLENKEEPRKVCSNCGAFIMGERFILEVKIGGQPVEKKTDLCQPCYNKLKEL